MINVPLLSFLKWAHFLHPVQLVVGCPVCVQQWHVMQCRWCKGHPRPGIYWKIFQDVERHQKENQSQSHLENTCVKCKFNLIHVNGYCCWCLLYANLNRLLFIFVCAFHPSQSTWKGLAGWLPVTMATILYQSPWWRVRLGRLPAYAKYNENVKNLHCTNSSPGASRHIKETYIVHLSSFTIQFCILFGCTSMLQRLSIMFIFLPCVL